jgi:hypothetical protein
MDLIEFINSPIKNKHIEHPDFSQLYVRKSLRYVRGVCYKNVFDIASVAAIEPGTGAFGRLVARLLDIWGGPICVESVQTKRFVRYLLAHGFVLADGPDNYILLR